MEIEKLSHYWDQEEIPGNKSQLTVFAVRVSELMELNGEQWVFDNRERLLSEWKLALRLGIVK